MNNEITKEEVKRLQILIDKLTKEEQNQILGGTRPKRLDDDGKELVNYRDFQVLRKSFNHVIDKKLNIGKQTRRKHY